MVGPAQVVPIGLDRLGDLDGDGFGDVVARTGVGERALRGARIESGAIDGNGDITIEGLGGRLPKMVSGDDGPAGQASRVVTHVAMDAPVLHLVNASSASDGVKFKAGAELSKSVN
jgi:hypothetical protein